MPIKENKSDSKAKSKASTLRILVIEPRGQYCRTVWCAIGIGMVQIFIGATIMTVFKYSLSQNDVHAFLCTIAYQFFSAEAVLSLNYANGWSTPLRLRHRRFAHIFLQICAIICAITGTVLITISNGISESVHGITGITTLILACITFLLGPFALYKPKLRPVHMGFGIPAFILSSICLCSGLYTPGFDNWAHSAIKFVLTGFTIFCTTFIMVTCFMKCMTRI